MHYGGSPEPPPQHEQPQPEVEYASDLQIKADRGALLGHQDQIKLLRKTAPHNLVSHPGSRFQGKQFLRHFFGAADASPVDAYQEVPGHQAGRRRRSLRRYGLGPHHPLRTRPDDPVLRQPEPALFDQVQEAHHGCRRRQHSDCQNR